MNVYVLKGLRRLSWRKDSGLYDRWLSSEVLVDEGRTGQVLIVFSIAH